MPLRPVTAVVITPEGDATEVAATEALASHFARVITMTAPGPTPALRALASSGSARLAALAFSQRAHSFARLLQRRIDEENIDVSQTLFITTRLDHTAVAPTLMADTGIRMVAIDSLNRPALFPADKLGALSRLAAIYAPTLHRCRQIEELSGLPAGTVRLLRNGYPDRRQPAVTDTSGEILFLTACRMDRPVRVAQMRDFIHAIAVARTTPVRWITAGSGKLTAELESASSKPRNLTVEHLGDITPAELDDLCNSRRIDWALHLTDCGYTAGALSAALMHGIPVVANDAGSVSEIVDDDCGLLLPFDPALEEFVRGIAPMLDSPIRSQRLRQGARLRWEKEFDASRIWSGWAGELTKL